MSETALYYFTGTGNTLHIAESISKAMPGCDLIPILKFGDDDEIRNLDSRRVGFIFPIYMTTLPVPMKRFIERLTLSEEVYLFALATRIGTNHSAFNEINSILKKKHKKLQLEWSFNMPSNDPKFSFKNLSENELTNLKETWEAELRTILPKLKNNEVFLAKDKGVQQKVPLVNFLRVLMRVGGNKPQKMYSNANCIGCGNCERVCLSGRIEMIDKSPNWPDHKVCYKCSACLNFCPTNASQIKGMTEKNGRYNHPFATIDQICKQKERSST